MAGWTFTAKARRTATFLGWRRNACKGGKGADCGQVPPRHDLAQLALHQSPNSEQGKGLAEKGREVGDQNASEEPESRKRPTYESRRDCQPYHVLREEKSCVGLNTQEAVGLQLGQQESGRGDHEDRNARGVGAGEQKHNQIVSRKEQDAEQGKKEHGQLARGVVPELQHTAFLTVPHGFAQEVRAI